MLTDNNVNYLKMPFRLSIIDLKNQSLLQALPYFSDLYLPQSSRSRKLWRKCSSSFT